MKPKITPLQQEVRMQPDEFIVSKTDTKGIITYCNREFIHMSGYDESELIGVQHNLIRHPDMPRGAFFLLWETLKKGEEFFAYVKNLRKDGKYYWVFANVTPSYDKAGHVNGYYSVRRAPSLDAINAIEPVYKQMLSIEQSHHTKDAIKASTDFLLGEIDKTGLNYDDFILLI